MWAISIAIEILVLVTALCLQLHVWRTIATDFHGDPVDYVRIAKSLSNSDHAGVSLLRFPGFPLFISITSWNFHYLQLTFLVQSLLFMAALVYFARSLAPHPLLRVVLYIPALLPTIACCQKLLFPTGSFSASFCSSRLRSQRGDFTRLPSLRRYSSSLSSSSYRSSSSPLRDSDNEDRRRVRGVLHCCYCLLEYWRCGLPST